MLSGQIVFEPNHKPFSLSQNTSAKSKIPEPEIQKIKEAASKDSEKEDEKSKLKLDGLLDRSSKVLIKVTTIFPFVLFPQHVIVDANKINIVKTTFFFSEHVHSVFIKDISDVVVETDLFFATLKIIDTGYTENSINISFLPKDEAQKAQRIIQGLVISAKEGVDLSILDEANLAEKIEQIGGSNQYSAA